MRSQNVSVIGAMAVVVGACGGGGGGDGGGTCGKVEPCGGDVTGTWKFTTGCLSSTVLAMDASMVAPDCPGLAVANAKVPAVGQATFRQDTTYAITLLTSFQFDMRVPRACFSGLTCAQADELLQLDFAANPDPDLQSIHCTGSDPCVCTAVSKSMSFDETGTYMTAGTTLATRPTGGGADTQDYCVQGAELHLPVVDRTMSMGALGQATIEGDYVARKQ